MQELFFASFLFLPSASSRSCFFFFSVLRFFFRLPSVVSFSFFGHPSESLWSSFGHLIMSLSCPFKEIPSSLPPFSLTVFQFSITNSFFTWLGLRSSIARFFTFHFSIFNSLFTWLGLRSSIARFFTFQLSIHFSLGLA